MAKNAEVVKDNWLMEMEGLFVVMKWREVLEPGVPFSAKVRDDITTEIVLSGIVTVGTHENGEAMATATRGTIM